MNKYTVVVILEAKPGKEPALKQALSNVIKPSRSETTCIEYRLHQDHNNPAQFVLFENWKNKEAHQAQFDKPYIQALAQQIDGLLAKPYQAFCMQELE
ncbi:MAG: antibiotic biosynthesis monooxygenase [Coxiellaceae bacterium]|nr:MAG: antibiotic biosynthesis monooxygenase [Coxiellaceae bacterium]